MDFSSHIVQFDGEYLFGGQCVVPIFSRLQKGLSITHRFLLLVHILNVHHHGSILNMNTVIRILELNWAVVASWSVIVLLSLKNCWIISYTPRSDRISTTNKQSKVHPKGLILHNNVLFFFFKLRWFFDFCNHYIYIEKCVCRKSFNFYGSSACAIAAPSTAFLIISVHLNDYLTFISLLGKSSTSTGSGEGLIDS